MAPHKPDAHPLGDGRYDHQGTHMPHNYGGSIGANLRSSALSESPFYRIHSTLKDGREIHLWLSSAADGSRVLGIRYSETRIKPLTAAVAVLNADAKRGTLLSGTVQLLDLARARTVFNLGPTH